MSNMEKLAPVSLWFIMNKKSNVKSIYHPSKNIKRVILSVQLLQ